MKILRTSLWVLLAWAVPAATIAAAGPYPKSAKDVMAKYLALDADAAGIAAASWPELQAYTTWKQFPNYDTFTVIDGYSIGKVVQGHTRAQVTVIYQTLGQLSDKFVPDVKAETVVFHLNFVDKQWKVDEPQLGPHVKFDVMKRRLEAAAAANPSTQKTNAALIAQIEQARSGAH